MSKLLATLCLGLLAAGCRTTSDDGTDRTSRTFRFVYEAAPKDIPEGAGKVAMWVPVPVDDVNQKVRNVEVALTAGGQTVTRPLAEIGSTRDVGGVPVRVESHPISRGGGRTLYVATEGRPFSVRVSYDVTRYETQSGGKATDADIERALKPDRMVPLGGKVSSMADGIPTGGTWTETARGLYDHTLERMSYAKPEGVPWGRGDAEWACDSRLGNCTDFHSYFIGLARTKGVPARFEMGFPIPAEAEGTVGGYHCWAYFLSEDGEWVPVDISEADKHPEKAEYFFGTLDENRFTVTKGRDLELTPPPVAGTLNFLVYPWIEVDGKEWKAMDKAFSIVAPRS